MFRTALTLLLAVSAMPLSLKAQNDAVFSVATADRFAKLALSCVHKEYPNKISHVMSDDSDVAPPRKLTPAFYGCYDWHSSVHGHWLLARLARTFPDASFAPAARDALQQSLTPDHIKAEVVYLNGQGRTSFERPYGLAWLLQLGQELREWDDPIARVLSANLKPLEERATTRLSDWLPKLTNPIRIGEHNQTAFSFGLLLDAARNSGDKQFEQLLTKKIRDFYLRDQNCPLSYEPSGEDFLSPCLAEADVVRRVLTPREFQLWLKRFLPEIPTTESVFLKPAIVTDPSDPKLAHLDGLNLSRSWMLEGIASVLPPKDPRLPSILATAAAHKKKGLAAVTGEHYEGGHWLGSFAVYLVTQRGISRK
jgi:Protein of unknown function (DUF2891)